MNGAHQLPLTHSEMRQDPRWHGMTVMPDAVPVASEEQTPGSDPATIADVDQ